MGETRRGRVGKKPARDSSGKKLTKQAVEAMDIRGGDITTSLLRGAVAGKSRSAEMLLSLADEPPATTEDGLKKQRPESVAKQLAAEPQWTWPIEEEKAETWASQRAPEG